jgi:hypothetical protein
MQGLHITGAPFDCGCSATCSIDVASLSPSGGLKHYNAALHPALFALPTLVRDLLAGEATPHAPAESAA